MKTFSIIGFGISGIISARYCQKYNYKFTIFEKNSQLGGCWFSKSYPNITLQTSKNYYCFSELDYDKSVPLYPKRHDIYNYLVKFSNKYNLKTHCKFNSNVKGISYDQNKKLWRIVYEYNNNKLIHYSDYIIVASGFYTDSKIPNIFNNKKDMSKIFFPEDFSYASKLNNSIFKNKKVVVIGNGPSGCDIAINALKYTNHVAMLYRTDRWIYKRRNYKYTNHYLLCRLIVTMVNYLPDRLYMIILVLIYKLLFITNGYDSNKILLPITPVTRNNLVLNEDILEKISNNKIKYYKTNNANIQNKVIKYNNTELDYDICVLCTGYENNISFLNFNKIPYLYKKIIHPTMINCAFIGFAPSYNWPQVCEIQIAWYLNYIQTTNLQKNSQFMKNYISRIKSITNKTNKTYDYHDLSIIFYDYIENLLKDITHLKNKYNKYNYKYWIYSPVFVSN